MDMPWDWHWHWYYLATVQASIVAALFLTLCLIRSGHHRDENGKTDEAKIVACFLVGLSVYTLSCLVVGNFFLSNLAWMIIDTFGEQRIGWMAVGLLADSAARLYVLFDP